MIVPRKICRVGNSTCVTLDKRMLCYLGVMPGDYVSLRITDGKIEIVPAPFWRDGKRGAI